PPALHSFPTRRSSDLAARLAEAVKEGVLSAGGLAFVFPTISLQESFAFPTSMLWRNLMAMDVEAMLGALPMDAVVLIGGCDKTIDRKSTRLNSSHLVN